MKKVILFAILSLTATQAFAGPYECQKECERKASQCIEDCTQKYTGLDWQQCVNACHQQGDRCRDDCTR